ncbi:hypothetical protein CN227_03645 [Sinorhizobium meliloti]|uniref:hypothetical protein n=1 Tax=Rhizobium meliloti TaxID=382 RepID=UPI000FD71E37|nr:hypothetical protein [Sinorhizobium meliloti]RVE85678.1 hypothetical protein CN240_01850 [Sinorhizobium meliloti]RVG49051.1 hypothetical protein CN227_03645 [Sinorhizobium meliloti]
MRSKSFGSAKLACLTLVALGACVIPIPTFSPSYAQTVAGRAIGEDASKFVADQQVASSKPAAEYTTLQLPSPNGIDVTATYQNGSKKIVQIEATRQLSLPGASGQFGKFEFGKTSLSEIRSLFGSKGLLFTGIAPVTATPDGGVTIVSSYEVQGTSIIASFASKISASSLRELKQRFGEDMYAHLDGVALLESTVVADIAYLIGTRGNELVYDVGYAPIVWKNPISTAVKPRQISVARISPSQLPVHRIYNGPINAPYFTDASARNFQTRISEGMAGGPTFAGEYAVIQVGCGTGCSIAYTASVRTGEVSRIPIDDDAAQYLDLKYQIDSRLLVAQSAKGAASKCHMQFLTMDEGEWISLLEHDVGPTETCYNSIAQNLRN